jgi:ABC-2 type transport system ATP-binding protein|tara:strand:- start:3176 stop:4186 length:1011 start_codon:yes stop_codon:yes gene_type:complete
MEPIPSIRVENLTRQFGGLTAIQNVSFTVNRGEIVGFLGPNGAGKSTTMRILSGIMPATSGSAWVSGVAVAQDPQLVKQRIGYMPENNPLPDDMRVIEYLRFRARLKGVSGRKLRATVQEVMETCDLARTARRKIIGTLSKGFRQRVGIADALLGNPEVIIMDEPTIGLDPHQIQGIRKLIDNLRGRLTVVLSSHILPEIERSCDRVIIINRGRIVASGTSDSLRQEFLPGNRFELQVAGSELSVTEALKAKGFEVEILQSETREDNILNLTLRVEGNGELGPQLIAALNDAADCTLRSLAPRVPNLEEIFLAATKRSWEETIDSSKAKPIAIAKS